MFATGSQHFSRFGRFAGSFEELTSADDTLRQLARTGERDGYKFTLSPIAHGYAINASPAGASSGIHNHYGSEPATASDPLVK